MAWVLWSYDWQPPHPKEYTLVVRAIDGTGELKHLIIEASHLKGPPATT
jgi:hypothetical protein